MTPKDLEQHFGSKAEIAKALGVALPTVYDWFDACAVPEPRQYQIELATDGRLRASKPADRRVITRPPEMAALPTKIE